MAFHALLSVTAVLALFPIAWLFTGSLQTIRELYDGVRFFPAIPQWQNYVVAWERGNLHTYLANSLLYATLVVIGILIASSMAGLRAGANRVPGPQRHTGRAPGDFDRAAAGLIYRHLQAAHWCRTREQAPGLYSGAGCRGITSVDLHHARLFHSPTARARRSRRPRRLLGLRYFLARHAAAGATGSGRRRHSSVPARVERVPARAGDLQHRFAHAGTTRPDQVVSSDTPEQHILLAATAIAVLPVVVLYAFTQRSIVQGIMEGAIKN